ncbi:short transient receptor potential channel 4-like [Gordionus sp. m RMFG-2023]|uniref:short transient receptor potential channel 4-like n=1 Tax=Gordionus sp. m RMFG-2023 TaxID=3053472 RepID=UPI0031FE4145
MRKDFEDDSEPLISVRPNKPSRDCDDCKRQDKNQLDISMHRLNTYKALSNETYLCLTSVDPILEAFLLSQELSNNACDEPELQIEYEEMNIRVRAYAVDLLNECINSEESKLLLNEQYGAQNVGEKIQEHFTRVKIARYLDQKEFIAHPITQRLLRIEWLGEWSTLSRQLRSPVNKFVSHILSYAIFLAILFMHSEFSENSNLHGPPRTGLEYYIIVWVLGLTWLLLKTLVAQGSKKFFSLWWNWYDLINLIAFYSTFLFWGLSYRDLLKNNHSNLERKYWDSFDPTLIAEGNFAIAKVLAFGKLLNTFQINKYLGPLQVSLGRMAYDILVFLVVYFLLLLSFATGLNHFYYYYQGMIKIEKGGLKKYQIPSFTTLVQTYKTLFWALFGMSPIESADVVISNYDSEKNAIIDSVKDEHSYTQTVGYILFAVFHLIAIIIFLNIMIAMMSNSFQKVQDNADVEWKFARTAVWMSYFEDGRTLPPPINLLPSMKSIMKLCSGQMFRKKKGKGDNVFDEEYQKLITLIIDRYTRHKLKS